MSADHGRFIVVEGIDGAGTTTQVERLAAWLRTQGIEPHATSEPSSGPVGSFIRQILRHRVSAADGAPRVFDWSTMALLFAADRLDHVKSEIRPALEAGRWVVSDRYDLSSLCYQSATAPTSDVVPWIRALNSQALRPDLTLVIDVPAEVAALRRGSRGATEELFEKDELQHRLAEVYARAEELVPGDALAHIDGTAAVEDVARRARAAVEALLRTPNPR